MTATLCHDDEIALFSETGESWFDPEAPDQPRPLNWQRSDAVTKIVIGTSPTGDETKEIAVTLPDNLAELYPKLTHLHLWQIGNLEQLPELPSGLKCLDVRGCESLTEWGGAAEELPQLETLLLDRSSLPAPEPVAFPALRELSVRQCMGISESWLHMVLRDNHQLHSLDASGCTQLSSLPVLPEGLDDLRLNDCTRLRSILSDGQKWPERLRRLELRNAQKLVAIPDFPASLDYVDLAYTHALRSLPGMPPPVDFAVGTRRPRTLILFESGIPLERDLYGESDDTNVADRVLSDLEASQAGRAADHELKVILLGNGRCGKSSFARKWIHGEFREDEISTHGIRLWEKEIPFTPVDDSDATAHLNIWDFAGQDLYHSTHRLFLQSRAIFLIFHTEHPPGADEDTDRREHAAIAREGEDVHRPPQYWIDQVQSLGKIPGLKTEPPMLVIRSKSDRDAERDVTDSLEVPYRQIVFSAKTDEGLTEISDWLQEQVSELLGPFEARSLPTSAMKVKEALNPRMQENRKRYWEMDEAGNPFQSPYPTVSRQEFVDIVQQSCTGMYAERPERLLERFHRSGYLYFNAAYLADDVILDQQWAIHGIYAFSSRLSKYNIRELLREGNGQFTAEQLSEYSWEPAGYDASAQRLFMNFMLSCGMCFRLLGHDESASGRTVYAAPGFFPSRAKAAERYPELNAGSEGTWARYRLAGATEVDVRSLIAHLGYDWSRSMQAWRWGCRVVSATTGAVCWIDWPRSDESPQYVFALDVWFSGPRDAAFEHYIRERVQRYLTHPIYSDEDKFAEEWKGVAPRELEKYSLASSLEHEAPLVDVSDEAEDSRRLEVRPSRDRAVGIRITLSFAGSEPRREEYHRIGDIPSLLGRKLHAQLTKKNQGDVLCYDRPEGEERLSVFTENLARGDLVLVFWSKKFWESHYCMTEMMLIYEQPPKERLLDKRVIVFVFDQQRLSRSGEIKHNEWEDAWERRAIERDDSAEEAAVGDLRKKTKLLDRDGILCKWYDLILREGKFDQFVRTLLDYRLGRPVSVPQNDEEVEQVADELFSVVADYLEDSQKLFELASQRLQQGRREDAVALLLHALAKSSDGGHDTVSSLLSSSNQRIPEELRQAAVEHLGLTKGD